MKRIMVAAVVVLGGCAATRPVPPGTIYRTVPQTQRYSELGPVTGSCWAYGDHENAAILAALDKAKALGGDAVVGLDVSSSCRKLWLWFIGGVGAPPCSSTAEGMAVKWAPLEVSPVAVPTMNGGGL